jgi:hypothetical protein
MSERDEHDGPVETERYEGREGEADPGAYVGRFPERGEETIPGGIGDDDERVAAHSTQGTGAGRPDVRGQEGPPASGHREGSDASDDDRREAGQTR